MQDWFGQSKVVSPVSDGPKFLRRPRKKRGVMASYRLTEEAKADLIRIYRRGLREYGEGQADDYYDALLDRLELLAERPLSYPAVDDIRVGYRRSVCGSDSIYPGSRIRRLFTCLQYKLKSELGYLYK